MDLFDIVSVVGETYINTKDDLKYNNDPIEVVSKKFSYAPLRLCVKNSG